MEYRYQGKGGYYQSSAVWVCIRVFSLYLTRYTPLGTIPTSTPVPYLITLHTVTILTRPNIHTSIIQE